MRERIYSLETEYAVAFYPASPDAAIPDADDLFEAVDGPLRADYGTDDSLFLINGSKFYNDQDHPEWSLPECRSAYEAALYDKAADITLASLLPSAQARLQDGGFAGRLLLVKNNVDFQGNTYGCHENYMAERSTEWLQFDGYKRLLARYLLPFLVTRPILCGSGRVVPDGGWESTAHFELSQRAEFIEEVVSEETTGSRAIVSLAREEEPFAAGNYRRLHLIVGDANLSGWATYMKLGMTGLLLRLLEELAFGDIPHLANPVEALHVVSRDPSCTARIPMRDGRELTAVEIQRIYLRQAADYLRSQSVSPESEDILTKWDDALTLLEANPMSLRGQADWVMKKYAMDRFLEKSGLTWKDVQLESPSGYALQRMDLEYHSLASDGLYFRMMGARPDTHFSAEEIANARQAPPPYTRAQIRGGIIRSMRRQPFAAQVLTWDAVRLGTRAISLPDPFAFVSPEVFEVVSEGMDDPGVRRRPAGARP